MARKVILPVELSRRLDKLTRLREEVKGVLFYQQRGEYCPLETMFMTAVGDEGHVQAIPERLDLVNEFFRRNPQYGYVEFHTHSFGTIARYGPYYARNFSSGDMDSLRDKLDHDERYIHMLVTPETKLLWGSDNPELIIRSDFPIKNHVDLAIGIIARNRGINIGSLGAHS